MTRILVVDDEPQILRALRINLTARQYDVVTAADGAPALRAAAEDHPDLVVLDLGLPDMDGVEVIRSLRGWTPVPIVVLSGRADSRDKVDALDAGADDYVTKPFSVDELLARIRAVTRRRTSRPSAPPVVADRPVHASTWPHQVARRPTTPAETVHLTRTEWQLLEVLLAQPRQAGQPAPAAARGLGTRRTSAETQYLRQYMAQLRRKLEADPTRPRHLLTEPGMGYRFQP